MRAVRSSLFAVAIALLACRGKTEHDSGADGSAGGAGSGGATAGGAGPGGATAGGAGPGGATAGSGGSSGNAGGSAGAAGTPANTGSCEPYCASKTDCCSDCRYPNNLDCVDRHCVSLGCTGDADCTRVDGPGSVCRPVLGVPRCIELCGSDADCNPPSVICAGRDDQGNAYCGRLPSLIRPCAANTDCTVGVCDPTTHQCGCSSDQQCQPGSICVPS